MNARCGRFCSGLMSFWQDNEKSMRLPLNSIGAAAALDSKLDVAQHHAAVGDDRELVAANQSRLDRTECIDESKWAKLVRDGRAVWFVNGKAANRIARFTAAGKQRSSRRSEGFRKALPMIC